MGRATVSADRGRRSRPGQQSTVPARKATAFPPHCSRQCQQLYTSRQMACNWSDKKVTRMMEACSKAGSTATGGRAWTARAGSQPPSSRAGKPARAKAGRKSKRNMHLFTNDVRRSSACRSAGGEGVVLAWVPTAGRAVLSSMHGPRGSGHQGHSRRQPDELAGHSDKGHVDVGPAARLGGGARCVTAWKEMPAALRRAGTPR